MQEDSFTFALAHRYTATAYTHLEQYQTALQHYQIALNHHPIDHEKALILEQMAKLLYCFE